MATAVRQKSLIVPREHGAWGILLVPLVTGAGVGLASGGTAWSLVPLTLAALALFWLRTPLESWIGTAPIRARAAVEIEAVRNAVAGLTAVSIGALIWLFWGGRNGVLVWIGAAAAAAFLLQGWLRRVSRSARTAAQMIGAAGLTATAPAAYCAVTGGWGGAAWTLWGANLLFAINQIHFVQLRIHAAHAKSRAEKLAAGRGFLAGQFVLMGLLATACAAWMMRWYGVVAFVPILFRGFAWFAGEPRPLAVHRLGKTELAYACSFGVLLVAALAPW
ncbi:MAG TPA: YwiC-like family protein [Bryobacteraceae bacterium]|nr:YwiC-like family protein [Bryobacteraceae bacterium]